MNNVIKILCISLLFLSCNNPKPTKDEIAGIWYGQGGIRIELKKNNSAKVLNYPLSLSHPDFKGIVNGTGTWKIIKQKNLSRYVIEISVTTNKMIPELLSDGIAIELLVANNSLGDDVTSLFIWKGDPDSDNRYEFVKQ